jgi:hypothetical protein
MSAAQDARRETCLAASEAKRETRMRSRRTLALCLFALGALLSNPPVAAAARKTIDIGRIGKIGAGDDTATFDAAFAYSAAHHVCVVVPAGTYSVGNLTGEGCLEGRGMAATVLRRSPKAASGNLIAFSGALTVRDLTLDGNKANVSRPENCLAAYREFHRLIVQRVRITGCHGTQHHSGAGIYLAGGDDARHGTQSVIEDSRIDGNTGDGIDVDTAQNLTIRGNRIAGNGGWGIALTNGLIASGITERNIRILGNRVTGNFAGIGAGSFNLAPGRFHPIDGSNPSASNVAVRDNEIDHNRLIGLAYQGRDGTIVGNDIHDNGAGGQGTGALLNAAHTLFAHNTVTLNTLYGVDAGGCIACAIRDNVISYNGRPSGGHGLHLGASVDTAATDNTLVGNAGAQITWGSTDNGGATMPIVDAWPSVTTGLLVARNRLRLTAPGMLGIAVDQAASGRVIDNVCDAFDASFTAAQNCYLFRTPNLATNGNRVLAKDGSIPALNIGGTLMIADGGTVFRVGGGPPIKAIETFSQHALARGVTAILVTRHGRPAVDPAGVRCTVSGDGSGARYVPNMNGDGLVIGCLADYAHSGNPYGNRYTRAAVRIAGGGVTGARARAVIGALNNRGRIVTLSFAAARIVIDDTAIRLVGSRDFYAGAGDTLTLKGDGDGNWREIAPRVGRAHK